MEAFLPRSTLSPVFSQRDGLILLVSILAHLLFLGAVTTKPPEPKEELLRVRLAPIPAIVEEPKTKPASSQLVSPPDSKSEPPKVETNFKSEKDFSAPVEQIKRGDGEARSQPAAAEKSAVASKSVKPVPKKPEVKKPVQEKPAERKPAGSDRPLLLPNAPATLTLTDKGIADALSKLSSVDPSEPTSEKKVPDRVRVANLGRYQPFSRNSFVQNPGIPDYLPKVRDGDITLLNAKADRYAVFVRRVASQVFGILRRTHWQELSGSELQRIEKLTTVRAILSPAGKLLSVDILEGSGSERFDGVVKSSAEKGASDPNPPPGAEAEDGNIHFIFKSRTWVRRGPQGLGEQRWLLLATGLL